MPHTPTAPLLPGKDSSRRQLTGSLEIALTVAQIIADYNLLSRLAVDMDNHGYIHVWI